MILYTLLISIFFLDHIRASNVPTTLTSTSSSSSPQATNATPIVTLSLESLKNLSNAPTIANAIPNVGVPTPSPTVPASPNASITGGTPNGTGVNGSDAATMNRDLSELKRRLDEDELKITRYIELTNILRDRYQELKTHVSSLVSGTSSPLPTHPNPAFDHASLSSSNTLLNGAPSPNNGLTPRPPLPHYYKQQDAQPGYAQQSNQGYYPRQGGINIRNQGHYAPYAPQAQAYAPSPAYAPQQLPHIPHYPQQQPYAQQPPYPQQDGYSDPNYVDPYAPPQSQLGYQSNYANLPAYVPNPQASRKMPAPGYYDANGLQNMQPQYMPSIAYPQNSMQNAPYAVPLVNAQTGFPLPTQAPEMPGGTIPTPFDTFNGGNAIMPSGMPIPNMPLPNIQNVIPSGMNSIIPSNGTSLPSTANLINGLTSQAQLSGQVVAALPTGSSLLSNFFGNTSPVASTNPANSSAITNPVSDISTAQTNPALSASSGILNTTTSTINTQGTLPIVSIASTQISSTQIPTISTQAPLPIQAAPIQATPTVSTTQQVTNNATVNTTTNTQTATGTTSSTETTTASTLPTTATTTVTQNPATTQITTNATQQIATAPVQTLQQQLQARDTSSTTASTSATLSTTATATTVAQPR